MALIKCKECGKQVSDTIDSCPHCGASIKEQKVQTCPECKHKVKGDLDACPNCGYQLKDSNFGISLSKLNDQIDKITGVKSKQYISFKDLFKGGFKKHTPEELDEVFTCGSSKTTPTIDEINPKKASAWVYLRVLLFFAIAYVPLHIGYFSYNNTNFLPGWIIIGSFAVPVTVLILIYELNLFKNIPFHKVLVYFIIGGCLSLITTILLSEFVTGMTTETYWGAMLIGLVEEIAKALIVFLFLYRDKKYNSILNGLLVGAAVGAGFAAFESAGYVLTYGLNSGQSVMVDVMVLRAFLAPGGHVAWAAIEGAGLMFIKGKKQLSFNLLFNKKYGFIWLIPIVLHGIWDMPFEWPLYLKYILLIFGAWVVVLYFINLGLKQLDDRKKEKRAKTS